MGLPNRHYFDLKALLRNLNDSKVLQKCVIKIRELHYLITTVLLRYSNVAISDYSIILNFANFMISSFSLDFLNLNGSFSKVCAFTNAYLHLYIHVGFFWVFLLILVSFGLLYSFKSRKRDAVTRFDLIILNYQTAIFFLFVVILFDFIYFISFIDFSLLIELSFVFTIFICLIHICICKKLPNKIYIPYM